MKSIVQEASSIERAIDKAWNEAGKPREFTIKVLDAGEKNFFGISKRPAVVSIVYSPKKEKAKSRPNNNTGSSDKPDYVVRERKPTRSKKPNDNKKRDRDNRDRDNNKQFQSKVNPANAHEWHKQWVTYVENSLRALLEKMRITTPFHLIVDKKNLTISFTQGILEDEEEQRMFFASISYMAIQFLKRQYKNKFVGFKIIVTTGEKSSSPHMLRSKNGLSDTVSSKRRSDREADREKTHEKNIEEAVNYEQFDMIDRIELPEQKNRKKKKSQKKDSHGMQYGSDDINHEQSKFAREQLEREEADQNLLEDAILEADAVPETTEEEMRVLRQEENAQGDTHEEITESSPEEAQSEPEKAPEKEQDDNTPEPGNEK